MHKLVIFALVAFLFATSDSAQVHRGFKRKIIPSEKLSEAKQQPIRQPRRGQISDSNSLAENLLALPEATEAVSMLRREQPELFQEVFNELHNSEGLTVLVPSNDAMSKREASETDEDEIRATIQYSVIDEPLSSSDIDSLFEEAKQSASQSKEMVKENKTESTSSGKTSSAADEQVESIFLTTLLNDPEQVHLLGHAQFIRLDRGGEGMRANKSASSSSSSSVPSYAAENEETSQSGTASDDSMSSKKKSTKSKSKQAAVKADASENEEGNADFQFVYGVKDGDFVKANVVKADIKCKNGYIHVIDRRPRLPNDVSDVVEELQLTDLKRLLDAHPGMEDVLNKVPAVTIFLPSDDAIKAFNQTSASNETSETSEESEDKEKEAEESGVPAYAYGKTLPIRTEQQQRNQPGQQQTQQKRLAVFQQLKKRQQLPVFEPNSLEASILNGVVQGVHFSSDFHDGVTLHTLTGGTLKLQKDADTGEFKLNDATIEMKDIIVQNGVVHVISKVFSNEDVKASEKQPSAGPMPIKGGKGQKAGQVSEEQTLLENLQAIPDFSMIAEMLQEKEYSDVRKLLSSSEGNETAAVTEKSKSKKKTANETESESESESEPSGLSADEEGLTAEQRTRLRSKARTVKGHAKRKKAAVVSAVRAKRSERAETPEMNETSENEPEKIGEEEDLLGFDLSNASTPLTLFFPTNDALYRMYLKLKETHESKSDNATASEAHATKANFTGNFKEDWSIQNYRQLPRHVRRHIKAGVLYHILQGAAVTTEDLGPINVFDTLLNDPEYSKMRDNASLPLVILNTAANLSPEGSTLKKAKISMSAKANQTNETSSSESESESSSEKTGLDADEDEEGFPAHRRQHRRQHRRYGRRFSRRFDGLDADSDMDMEGVDAEGSDNPEDEQGFPVYRRHERRYERRYGRRYGRRFDRRFGMDADMETAGMEDAMDAETGDDNNPDEAAVAVVVPVQSPIYAPAYYPQPYPVPVPVRVPGGYHPHAHYRPARAQHRRYERRYGRRFGRRFGADLDDFAAAAGAMDESAMEDQDQQQLQKFKQEPTPIFIQFGLQSHPGQHGKAGKSERVAKLKSRRGSKSAENTTESESSESESESEKPSKKSSKLKSKSKKQVKSKAGELEVSPFYSMVVIPDIISSNGVLHGIDTVLEVPRSLNDTMRNTDITDFLTSLEDEGELENILNTEGITVLYPNNDALRSALEKNTSGSENRTNALLDFIIDENVLFTADLMNETSVTAMSGNDIKISFDEDTGSLMINNLSIIVGDVLLNNGVMHILGEKPKKLESQSCDKKKCGESDECCEVLVSGIIRAQCYNPDTHVCTALKGSKLCPRLAPNVCGSACFSESQFVCLAGDLLCPLGFQACGSSCFDPEIYECDAETSKLSPMESQQQQQQPEQEQESEEKPKPQAVKRRT